MDGVSKLGTGQESCAEDLKRAWSAVSGEHCALTDDEKAEWVQLYLAGDKSARYFELNCKRCGGTVENGIYPAIFGAAAADLAAGKSSDRGRALVRSVRARIKAIQQDS